MTDERLRDISNYKTIYLAGGCFWGVDAYMKQLKGIIKTESGYANGHTINPSYEEVCTGKTGHAETVYVQYDPAVISLKTILEQFFSIIDPTQINRQAGDIGEQYRNGIYYTDDLDLLMIEAVMRDVQKEYTKVLATEVGPLKAYYVAESYHQDYLEKNPNGYCHVRLDSVPDTLKGSTV